MRRVVWRMDWRVGLKFSCLAHSLSSASSYSNEGKLSSKICKLIFHFFSPIFLLKSLWFGSFLSCLNSSYKLLLCLFRRYLSNDDRLNSAFAGSISSLAILLDTSSSWSSYLLIILSWSLLIMLTSLHSKGVPVKVKYGEVFTAVVWMMFVGFCYTSHFELMPALVKQSTKRFANFEYNHFKMMDLIRSRPGGDLFGTWRAFEVTPASSL